MEGGHEHQAHTATEVSPAPAPKSDDISLAQVKKYLPYILLAAILIFGFSLRSYHLGYPVIGYHNWKEEHYLSEARNFAEEGFFAHGFFVPAWDLPFLQEDPAGSHADTFPTISILGGIAYSIFGENLAVLRGIGVILNLASIIVLYLIVKRLFKREDLALTTAALAALNPLMIFFSRNFQLDSPALFLCLLGTWFYIKWIEKDKPIDGILASFFVLFGIITKYSFIVMAIPMVALFPWKRYMTRAGWDAKQLKVMISGAFFLFLSLTWLWYMEVYFKNKIKMLYNVGGGGAVISLTEIIQFTVIFTSEFWQVMSAFIFDNFTKIGIFASGAGLILLALMWKKNKEGSKYFLTYAGFGLFFFTILSYKLSGHSYHQFPYAPLVVFLIAYAFVVIAATISSFTPAKARVAVKWGLIVLFALALWPGQWGIQASLDRQFGVQFFGLDIAGEFIRANSEPAERIFHSSQQNYGVLWHSDRKGYKLPDDLAGFKDGESKGVEWVFIYNWRFNFFQSEAAQYVRDHYQLRQIGFMMQGTQFVPYYFLLQRGGTFDENKLNGLLSGQPTSSKVYQMPQGDVTFNYITLPRYVEPIPEPLLNITGLMQK